MKRLLAGIIVIMFASWLFAGTGSIDVYPKQVPRDYFGATIEIIYTPDNAAVWTSGKLSLTIPDSFYPAPTTVTATQGNLRVFRITAGTVTSEVPSTSIETDGYAVTINSIALTNLEALKIVYGYAENIGEGVQTPYMPGDYFFKAGEDPSGASLNTLLNDQTVHVSDIAITKSVNKPEAIAGDTLTYTITYSNISPYHPSQNITIWDTIPEAFEILEVSSTPDSITGNLFVWSKSMLTISDPVDFTVAVKVKPEAITFGSTATNMAEIKASDMYSNEYYEKSSVAIPVKGVALSTMIMTNPTSSAVTGQQITVILRVQNTGNTVTPYASGSVSPTNSNAVYTGGPYPSSVSILPLQYGMLTWIYTASAQGVVAFSASASAQSGYTTVSSVVTVSNQIYISEPVPTHTETPVPVDTATSTYTPVPSSTSTYTYTASYTATEVQSATQTFTQIITPTMTYTKTPTPVISATPSPQQSPSKTPDVPVFTSKNIFNPGNNESVTITYKLPYSSKARVWIYNLNGEVVAELMNKEASGTVSVTWDGKNEKGKIIGRGIYFMHVKQGNWQVIKKIIVLK